MYNHEDQATQSVFFNYNIIDEIAAPVKVLSWIKFAFNYYTRLNCMHICDTYPWAEPQSVFGFFTIAWG